MSDADISGIEQHETGVDLGGLMAVLSEHLYSTSDVAIRELVQNAHDSMVRRSHLDASPAAQSIRVNTDAESGTVSITDTGSGLTHDEVHRYLATVGVGATRELRTDTESDELIGMFGLGFLSVFVVADLVTVTTTSCQTPNETWQYISTDGQRYAVLAAGQHPVGTTVSLQLKASHSDLADASIVGVLLERYCRLLRPPISLNSDQPINLAPPWRSEDDSDDQRIEFATQFESRFEPLAAIPIEMDAGLIDGVLWIHGGSSYANADNRQMSVFVRGMLLADDEIDLLPRWAGFVSGAIESTVLTPTASRESLQRDTTYTEVQMAIAEALITGLSNLAVRDAAAWARVLDRHNEALLGAAISDDRLFDLVSEHVRIPTSSGDSTARSLRQGRRIHATLGAERGFEEILFRTRGVPIARGDRFGVLTFLHKYASAHDLDLIEIGTDRGNEAVFGSAPIDADDLAWLEQELAGPDEMVMASAFEPVTMPLVVIPDREAELKRRLESDDLRRSSGGGMANLARLHAAEIEERPPHRVYVNLACPTIGRLLQARTHDLAGSTRAVTFLRTLKTVMAAADRARGGSADLNDAFAESLAVIDGLLIPPTTSTTATDDGATS